MEMKTMYENEMNEFGETVEYEYLIPLAAIEKYLGTSDEQTVTSFLEEEYNSEDTDNIISECIRKDLNYELITSTFL